MKNIDRKCLCEWNIRKPASSKYWPAEEIGLLDIGCSVAMSRESVCEIKGFLSTPPFNRYVFVQISGGIALIVGGGLGLITALWTFAVTSTIIVNIAPSAGFYNNI